jgi:ParB-like chromosome segregation protein Spo0J
MNLEEVALERIDWDDERFRISEELFPGSLAESLRQVGQLSAVHLLVGDGPRYTILCGFRRLRALQRLGLSPVLSRLSPAAELSNLAAFRIALWENLSHRVLTALEKARALWTLKNLCGADEENLVEIYLPLLGLQSHKNILRSYLRLHQLHPGLRQAFNQGIISLASAERLAAGSPEFQKGMVSVLDRARWSSSLQREVFDLVDELSVIMEQEAVEIFDRPELAAVLANNGLSSFQKGEQLHKILYRLRNPRLSVAEECFQVEKNKLDLPGNLRISPAPFFESPRVKFEFDASSADSFRKIAEALNRVALNPGLDGLFGAGSCSKTNRAAVQNRER